MTSKRTHYVIALAAGIWALMLIADGSPLRWSFLRPYELVVGAVLIVVNFYDWKLWRLWPLVIVSPAPLLHGTWRGELRSSWVDPATHRPIDPIQVYLAVDQQLGVITTKLFTPTSSSVSTTSALAPDGGVSQFTTTYRNTPDLLKRSTSPIHHGTMILDLSKRFPTRLTGSYWTDRGSQGEVAFDSWAPDVAGDVAEAKRLKYRPGVSVSSPIGRARPKTAAPRRG